MGRHRSGPVTPHDAGHVARLPFTCSGACLLRCFLSLCPQRMTRRCKAAPLFMALGKAIIVAVRDGAVLTNTTRLFAQAYVRSELLKGKQPFPAPCIVQIKWG